MSQSYAQLLEDIKLLTSTGNLTYLEYYERLCEFDYSFLESPILKIRKLSVLYIFYVYSKLNEKSGTGVQFKSFPCQTKQRLDLEAPLYYKENLVFLAIGHDLTDLDNFNTASRPAISRSWLNVERNIFSYLVGSKERSILVGLDSKSAIKYLKTEWLEATPDPLTTVIFTYRPFLADMASKNFELSIKCKPVKSKPEKAAFNKTSIATLFCIGLTKSLAGHPTKKRPQSAEKVIQGEKRSSLKAIVENCGSEKNTPREQSLEVSKLPFKLKMKSKDRSLTQNQKKDGLDIPITSLEELQLKSKVSDSSPKKLIQFSVGSNHLTTKTSSDDNARHASISVIKRSQIIWSKKSIDLKEQSFRISKNSRSRTPGKNRQSKEGHFNDGQHSPMYSPTATLTDNKRTADKGKSVFSLTFIKEMNRPARLQYPATQTNLEASPEASPNEIRSRGLFIVKKKTITK